MIIYRLRFFLFTYAVLCLASSAKPQVNTSAKDSLLHLYSQPAQHNPQIALQALHDLAHHALMNQHSNAVHAIQQYIAYAVEKGQPEAEMHGTLFLVQYHLQQGHYDEAQKGALDVIRFFQKKASDPKLAEAIIRYGNALEAMGKTDSAHAQFFKALNLVQAYCKPQSADLCGISACMANMFVGSIYWKQGLEEKAAYYVEEAKNYIEHLYNIYPDNPDVLYEYATLLANMASLARGPKSKELKILYFQRARNLFQHLGILHSEVAVLYNIGHAYFHQNAYDLAQQYLQEAIDLSKKGHDPTLPLASEILLAHILLIQNKVQEASTLLDEAEPLAWSANLGKSITDILKLRARIDSIQEDYPIALRSLSRYYKVRDSFFNQEKIEWISGLEKHYLEEKVERERAQIEIELERSRAKQTFRVSAIVLLFTILLAGTIITVMNNRILLRQREFAQQSVRVAQLEQEKLNAHLEKKEIELAYKNKELATMASRLVERTAFIEQLRTYLSHDPTGNPDLLHDLKKQLSYQEQATGDLEEFRLYMDEVNQDFFFSLTSAFPDLSEKEKRLCALFRMDMSVKEMAVIINVSENAIRTAKHRIKKKLHLEDQLELDDFLKSI